MSIDNDNLLNFVNARHYDIKRLEATIADVTNVVLKRHFRQEFYNEELRSLARCKAIMLLNASHVRKSGNLVSFLYTGIRNEVGNNLKKEERKANNTEAFSDVQMYDSTHLQSSDESGDKVALEGLQSTLDDISQNFLFLGIDIQGECDDFFRSYDSGRLSLFGGFALRAAALRTVIEIKG